MSTYYWFLLIIIAIASGGYSSVKAYYYFRRRVRRAKFRDYFRVLIGVNPRNGRKTVYETAPIARQKLSWLLAQNREIITEGLKEFAEAQSVDNSSVHMDTFGVRSSAMEHRRLVQKVLSVTSRRFYAVAESARVYLRRVRTNISVALKALPRVIIHTFLLLRSLLKLTFGSGGEADGTHDSIHQNKSVRRYEDS